MWLRDGQAATGRGRRDRLAATRHGSDRSARALLTCAKGSTCVAFAVQKADPYG